MSFRILACACVLILGACSTLYKRISSIALLVCTAIVLASCGGGGGGSVPVGGGTGSGSDAGGSTSGSPGGPVITGTGAAPNSGPGDTSFYFPTATGNTWLFDASATTGGVTSLGTLATTISGPVNLHGINVTAIQTSASPSIASAQTTNYYASSAGGLTYYGNSDASDTVTPYLVPSILLPFPIRTGSISTINATGLPGGTTDTGDPIVFNVTQSTSIQGVETISVAAGTFANTVRSIQTIAASAVDTKTGMSLPLSAMETIWYAPGVGVVKDSQSSSINGGTPDTQDSTLRSYTVNGVFHGIGTPFSLFASASSIGNAMPGFGATSATDGNVVANILTSGSRMLQISSATGGVLATESLTEPVGVFFDGINFEVLTIHNSSFYSQRVSPQGAMIDAAPGNAVAPLVAGCGNAQAVFAGGNGRTLAVLLCYQPQTSLGQLYGLVIPADGTPSAQGLFLIHTNGTTQAADSWPAVASDGSNFLVTWNLTTAGGLRQIVAQRVGATGSLLDTSPFIISDASSCQQSPDVAFDGANYMVVWLDGRHVAACGQPDGEIYGMRVSTAGALLDGTSSTGGFVVNSKYTGAGHPAAPLIGFNGSEYVVAWSDLAASTSSPPLGILGERVSKSGQVLTTAPFAISGPPPSNGVSPQPFILTARAFSSRNSFISWAQLYASGNSNAQVQIAAP